MKNTRELTPTQKEYLLQTFFTLEGYEGWRGIASKLLETGECVVAGNICIWRNGGIGNFITTETAEGFFGCIKYKFDLDIFLNSAWFKEATSSTLDNLIERKRKVEDQITDISRLTLDLTDISLLNELKSDDLHINKRLFRFDDDSTGIFDIDNAFLTHKPTHMFSTLNPHTGQWIKL